MTDDEKKKSQQLNSIFTAIINLFIFYKKSTRMDCETWTVESFFFFYSIKYILVNEDEARSKLKAFTFNAARDLCLEHVDVVDMRNDSEMESGWVSERERGLKCFH